MRNDWQSERKDDGMSRLREDSLEMMRHESSLKLTHLEHGRTKSCAETKNLEKYDRINLGSNF